MAFGDLDRVNFRHWPAREAVSLIQAGTGGQTFSVATAMRSPPVTRSEKQPTGARYLVSDVTWRVPGPLLPAGTILLPGDRINADAEFRQAGTATDTWTVLRAELNPWDQVWTLDAILLGLHPRLSDVVTIQRPAKDPVTGLLPVDDAGGEIFSWESVYVDEPCIILKRSREDMDLNDVAGSEESYLIVLGRELELTVNRDRVLVGQVGTGTALEEDTLVLDIVSYDDMQLIDELPQLMCVRKP